ncbi:MAG TPA: trypsin-like peptidase domain-containing protein [Thermoanaerobaculia bacterium]
MFRPRSLRSLESLGWLRGPKLWILIAAASGALRCATAKPTPYPSPEIRPIEERRPIPAGDGWSSAVEFRKFLIKLPDDHVIGALQVGRECTGREPLTWKIGRDSTVTQDFGALLLEEVASAGYGVVGKGDVLFEDSHEKKADYVVAGIIRDVHANVCYADPKKSLATAEASLVIDWQVYSYRARDVAFRLTTEGSSLFLRPQPEPGADAISRAVVAASRNLLAEPRFHELLAGNGVDRNPQPRAPIAIAYETVPKKPSKSAESLVADSRMAVVTVFAGDSMGSGFLISRDGYLLTDEHVVGTSRYVRVKFVTGREANGEVVRADRKRDVALVKLEGDVYPYLPLGESSRVQPGADVFAIGTPLEETFGQTVTKGIVSGYGEEDGQRILRSDVNIQKGNSGGPLLDRSGVVVGLSVNAYTLLPDGIGIGLNGFIPIEEALHALTIQREAPEPPPGAAPGPGGLSR